MKLTFLGTRGEIDIRTRLHRMHSSVLVSYRGARVMIDCGADWLRRVRHLRLDAIILTHAHPDHAGGLKAGSPCRVYATAQTWAILGDIPVAERVVVEPRTPFCIKDITFEAFVVEHSLRAPAVGYRITAGRSSVFYVPDLVYIHEPHEALRGVRIYCRRWRISPPAVDTEAWCFVDRPRADPVTTRMVQPRGCLASRVYALRVSSRGRQRTLNARGGS